MLANFLVPILSDGWRFIALFAGARPLPCRPDRGSMAVLAAIRRDPVVDLFSPRSVAPRPQDDGLLIAPADGLVQMVVQAVPPVEQGLGHKPLTRASSIFLSVFDVHIKPQPLCCDGRGRILPSGQVPECQRRQGPARTMSDGAGHCAARTAGSLPASRSPVTWPAVSSAT